MKRKLLFIPISAIVLSITGCFERRQANPIDIRTWLSAATTSKRSVNFSKFKVKKKNAGYLEDASLSIRDKIRAGLGDAEKENYKDSEGLEADVSYEIFANYDRFDRCFISVYKEGYITSYANGGGWGAPKEQYYKYTITKEAAKEIIDYANFRYDELNSASYQQYLEAKENYNIDKFIANLDTVEDDPKIDYLETRGVLEDPRYTVVDTNKEIFKDIKGLVFEEMDKEDLDILPMISYYSNQDWKFEIFYYEGKYNYDVAAIEYVIERSGNGWSSYHFFYKINATKGANIAQKVRDLRAIQKENA